MDSAITRPTHSRSTASRSRDQQSKVFSNQIPLDAVQSMEVIEGAPPAEYGDKTSLVIVVTTRSGLGVTQPHGEITTSFGSFGTVNGGANLAYGGNNWGNFISLNGLNTSRFLDGPEFTVMHDHGNEQNFFDRLDLKPSSKRHHQLEFRLYAILVPDAEFVRCPKRDGLVRDWCVDNGGLGPNGQLVGPTDQRFEDQNVQHRADLDAYREPEHGVHASAASRGRINSTTIRAPTRSPTSFRIFNPTPSARIAG